ncbi:unnamed protein product [Nippostrongylus brasiliensis]|uniref:N-acetyltransferase domain-containing protein n=1 Tax=Nippostrongylus brasiliensis TaxID=27835 RepID=A0A0N4YEV8_NIPBR|nr:unnamed protein product [Nippostrongylus brasiliensis]
MQKMQIDHSVGIPTFWDLVPPQFQRCIHALYVVVAPSWQSRGAAVILTAAALRHAKDVGADMAIAEIKGSDRSVLAVTFFQKTLIESKL